MKNHATSGGSGNFDIIIVGAGHNGLVAAFYLARAGLRVLIVEARNVIGGCCVTEELIPGYKFSTCANVLWGLRPKIVRDMALAERGLKVHPRSYIRLLPDGRFLASSRLGSVAGGTAPGESARSLLEEIAKFSAADADAFPRWQEFLGRMTRIFGPWLLRPPPRLHEIYAGCGNEDDRKTLDAVLTTSIAELADRYFESDVMRDVGVAADMPDPNEVGTGLLFALITAMGGYSETGDPVLNGYVDGGMGRLCDLMAEAAVEKGAVIRTEAPVARILTEKGRAVGVALKSGETLLGRAVVSNADPKRTFLSLVSPADFDPKFLERVRRLRTQAAVSVKIHCALSAAPEYRTNSPLTPEQALPSCLLMGHDRAYRERAWRAAKEGDLPEEPMMVSFLPSAFDPSLAPPGKHTWSAYIYLVPAHPRQGPWSDMKEAMAERILRMMDRATTNFRRALIGYVVKTPEEMEATYALTDGNYHQIDGIPSQLLWQRPLEELAHYRAPIAGLYLCGAACHPFGEVTGAPGHNAAQVILSDLGIQHDA